MPVLNNSKIYLGNHRISDTEKDIEDILKPVLLTKNMPPETPVAGYADFISQLFPAPPKLPDGFVITSSVPANPRIVYSKNGIWNEATLPNDFNRTLRTVAYGNGVYVALSYIASVTEFFLYSTDGGETWNYTNPIPETGTLYNSIAYGNGVFVAISSNWHFVVSSDGINWSKVTIPSEQFSTYQSINFIAGKFYAVSQANKLLISENGLTWTLILLPSSGSWYDIMYNGVRMVIPKYNTNVFAYSDDLGATWTECTIGATATGAVHLAWGSIYAFGKFICFNWAKIIILISDDGLTWTEIQIPYGCGMYQFALGGGVLVAPAGGVGNQVNLTTNGINYGVGSAIPTKGTTNWWGVCYGEAA
jgi:hypothetical protein